MRKINYKSPSSSKLSVVIPAYNAEKWIAPTLTKLWESLKKTKWKLIEILVIDDGSIDKTSKVAETVKIGVNVKVIRRQNSGRLKTRKFGIEKAKGDFVLLLDSRVYTQPNSFKYLVEQINQNPEALVWNGHIEVEREGNPFARFWYTITFIAWRRYMKHPRLMHYGPRDFDYYPKGAGCFFAPRDYLLDAYSKFSTYYKDDRSANDDTSLIRHITSFSDIYISPKFAFTYNSRSTWKAFINHTLHRGVVFIDGHLHRGGRFFYPAILYLILAPIFLVVSVFYPAILLVVIPILFIIFTLTKILGAETADAAALAYIMPIFAIFYSFGLYKGLILRLKQ